jgi:hypothetical protein
MVDDHPDIFGSLYLSDIGMIAEGLYRQGKSSVNIIPDSVRFGDPVRQRTLADGFNGRILFIAERVKLRKQGGEIEFFRSGLLN